MTKLYIHPLATKVWVLKFNAEERIALFNSDIHYKQLNPISYNYSFKQYQISYIKNDKIIYSPTKYKNLGAKV